MSSSPKLRVGLLGATGTVGQRFILLLSDHPNFQISVLGASSSSAGKTYKDAVAGRWKQVKEIPRDVKDVVVGDCSVDRFRQCDVVFSGLDSGPAAEYGELHLLGTTRYITFTPGLVQKAHGSLLPPHLRCASCYQSTSFETLSCVFSQTPRTTGKILCALS